MTDPRGAAQGDSRINRGGSAENLPGDIRPAGRARLDTIFTDEDLGFRLALTAP